MLLYQFILSDPCLNFWEWPVEAAGVSDTSKYIAWEAMSYVHQASQQSQYILEISREILTKKQREVWRFDTATDLPQGWPAAHCHAAAVSRGEILKDQHTAGCHAGRHMWTMQTWWRNLSFKAASSQLTNSDTWSLGAFPIGVAQAIFQQYL